MDDSNEKPEATQELTPGQKLDLLLSRNSLTPEEEERRARARQRLKERLSLNPWYKKRLEGPDGDRHLRALHGSCVLSD